MANMYQILILMLIKPTIIRRLYKNYYWETYKFSKTYDRYISTINFIIS